MVEYSSTCIQDLLCAFIDYILYNFIAIASLHVHTQSFSGSGVGLGVGSQAIHAPPQYTDGLFLDMHACTKVLHAGVQDGDSPAWSHHFRTCCSFQ